MDHSVQGYLERMPIVKLHLLLQSYFAEEAYAVPDDVLQDVLEVLIARNATEGGCLSPYIDKIREIQTRP